MDAKEIIKTLVLPTNEKVVEQPKDNVLLNNNLL